MILIYNIFMKLVQENEKNAMTKTFHTCSITDGRILDKRQTFSTNGKL